MNFGGDDLNLNYSRYIYNFDFFIIIKIFNNRVNYKIVYRCLVIVEVLVILLVFLCSIICV